MFFSGRLFSRFFCFSLFFLFFPPAKRKRKDVGFFYCRRRECPPFQETTMLLASAAGSRVFEGRRERELARRPHFFSLPLPPPIFLFLDRAFSHDICTPLSFFLSSRLFTPQFPVILQTNSHLPLKTGVALLRS